MKKSDLASHVATQAALSKAQAHSAVDAVFSAIGEALASGESVVIPGFGTFTPKARAARQGRTAHRQEHRHRGLQGAFVQGWQVPSRRGACGTGTMISARDRIYVESQI